MLSDEVKKLEELYEKQRKETVKAMAERNLLQNKYDFVKGILDHNRPVKVMYHKGRRNTTVKFKDGTCTTVKLKKGEKHCIETAIAYAIMKQAFQPSYLKKLVQEMELTDKSEDKKEE